VTRFASAAFLLCPLLVLPAGLSGQSSGLQLNGEVGFRLEFIRNEFFVESEATLEDDYRLRLRARLRVGGEYSVSDEITLGFRLSTGDTDYPSSAWSDLDDDFRRVPIAVDRAYVNIQPFEPIQLRVGFFGNPMFRATEMVWDDDVSPVGAAEVLRFGNWELVAGQYFLREMNSLEGSNVEQSFLLTHGASYTIDGPTTVRLGGFHYVYSDADVIAQALDVGLLDADFRTNRVNPQFSDIFFSYYNILGGSFTVSSGNFRVAGELSVNTAYGKDATAGAAYADPENIAVGGIVSYGQQDEPWDVQVDLGFFHIEADAVIAAYNSDNLQQTNVNSVPVWLRLALPGGAGVVWDTYLQKKIDTNLPSPGGIVHGENATKLRTRVTLHASF
jgi:hypothetical protein